MRHSQSDLIWSKGLTLSLSAPAVIAMVRVLLALEPVVNPNWGQRQEIEMKHNWEAIALATPDRPFADMSHHGARKCRNCGAVQQKNAQHSWMRVTGYRWEPLVGRCKQNRRNKI